MASTVKVELDKANPNNLPDLNRLVKMGKGLAVVPRVERLAVAAHVATPSQKVSQILGCFIVAAGANQGWAGIAASETTPAASNCAVDQDGNVEFAAADAVTLVELTYLPIEEDLITEVIPVTAGGLGTFNDGRASRQIVSAALNADATTPGAKTVVARGTVVGALGAGECAVQFDNTTIQFVAAEAGVACTATVSYHAFPGIGLGAETALGDRLDAAYTP
jgi:hypothetical protein